MFKKTEAPLTEAETLARKQKMASLKSYAKTAVIGLGVSVAMTVAVELISNAIVRKIESNEEDTTDETE